MPQFLYNRSAEYLAGQQERFHTILETEFKEMPARLQSLRDMYDFYGSRLATAPASTTFHFHYAYPGGYIDHILNVYDTVMKMISLYKSMGGYINFTRQEATLCALHHDLGKLGDDDGEFYIVEQEDFWKRKGKLYKVNPLLKNCSVYERTIYMLQKFGVTMTKNEIITIKLTDGLFDDANKKYYMCNDPFPFETNLPYLMHWADHMSTIVEKSEAQWPVDTR